MRKDSTDQMGRHGVDGARSNHHRWWLLRNIFHRHDVRHHGGIAAREHHCDGTLVALIVGVIMEPPVQTPARRHCLYNKQLRDHHENAKAADRADARHYGDFDWPIVMWSQGRIAFVEGNHFFDIAMDQLAPHGVCLAVNKNKDPQGNPA